MCVKESGFAKCNAGSLSIIIGLFIGSLVLGILAVSVDLSKSQNILLSSQSVSDSAALSLSQHITRAQIEKSNIDDRQLITDYQTKFKNEMRNKYSDILFDDSNSSISIEKETKDFYNKVTLNECVISKNNFPAFSDTKICVKSVAKVPNSSGVEVAIAVDNSANMAKPLASNPLKTGLDAAKDSLRIFSSTIAKNTSQYQPGTLISILPYSDTVKLNPAVANTWLRSPYSPASKFGGCMGLRNNANDKLDTPATSGSNALLFDRYVGPFNVPGAVKVIGKAATGQTLKQLNYNVSYQPAYDEMWINFPNNDVINAQKEGYYDRIPTEIDYIINVGASESLEVDLGAPYAAAITSLDIERMVINEGEMGQWVVYDNNTYKNPITSGIFYGAAAGSTFGVSNITSPKAFSYLTIKALDNGNRSSGMDWGAGWQYDNSDFAITRLRFPLACNVKESLILEQNKNTVDNYVNALQGDGPTRSNIGLVWAWRAVSSAMLGKWGVSTTHPDLDSSKFVIMLTQGRNFYPTQDDPQMLEVCTNIKNSGTSLYYITFDADAQTQSLGQQCASSGLYYNTTSPTELTNAFKQIAEKIRTYDYQSVLSQ